MNYSKKMENAYDYVKSRVSKKRYEHVIGTMNTAVKLAERYSYNVDKARIAGLLHDCAKNVPLDEMIRICKKNGMEPDELQKNSTSLLHGHAGAYMVREDLGEDDNEIIEAIRWHTTGKPGMSLLEKIIFIADLIEPSRNYDDIEVIRKEAFENLDKALILSLEGSMAQLRRDGKIIHPYTIETYDFYIKEQQMKGEENDKKL